MSGTQFSVSLLLFFNGAPPPAPALIRVTQEVLEVLGAASPFFRVTQENLEVLGQNALPFARVTQENLEVLAGVAPPQMRVSQHVLEVLVRYGPDARTRFWGTVIYGSPGAT